jgi:hypothetical protein
MDRIWHVLCVKCMEVIGIYFFLVDILFFFWGGGILKLDKYVFPWQTCFWEACLRLESFCIWVHMVFETLCGVQFTKWQGNVFFIYPVLTTQFMNMYAEISLLLISSVNSSFVFTLTVKTDGRQKTAQKTSGKCVYSSLLYTFSHLYIFSTFKNINSCSFRTSFISWIWVIFGRWSLWDLNLMHWVLPLKIVWH